jgi:hypothetical protein
MLNTRDFTCSRITQSVTAPRWDRKGLDHLPLSETKEKQINFTCKILKDCYRHKPKLPASTCNLHMIYRYFLHTHKKKDNIVPIQQKKFSTYSETIIWRTRVSLLINNATSVLHDISPRKQNGRKPRFGVKYVFIFVIHASREIRTHDPTVRVVQDFRPHGHWDRPHLIT